MGTTSKSIGKFLRNMCFPTNTYFTVGMNGKNQMKLKSNVQDYHNSFFNQIKNINKPLKDHSKMLFFLDPNSVNGGLLNQKEGDIELKDTQLLLKGCTVKAVLIGSSNQSYNTYFKDPADKGEADVFMIKDIALVKEDDKTGSPLNDVFFDKKAEELYNKITDYEEANENKLENVNNIILSKRIKGGDNFLDEILQASLIKQ